MTMKTAKKVYAEEVNYWRTSSSSPDTWLDKTIKLIKSIGGEVDRHAIMNTKESSVIFISFSIEGDSYEITFPVLPCKKESDATLKSAKVQASTALYHSVKAKIVYAKFLGVRAAFIDNLLLSDGKPILTHLKEDNLPLLQSG
jgi:hypothetical protein